MSVLSASTSDADKDFKIAGEALDNALYYEGLYKGKEEGFKLILKQKEGEIFWRNLLIGALVGVAWYQSEKYAELIQAVTGN